MCPRPAVEARGAVLDFDGVLVASMELHAEAYRRVLAPLGVRVEDARVFALEGARSETILRDLLADAGERVAPDELRRLADEKQGLYVSLGPPRPYPGAEDLVRRVRQAALRMAVVTGTRRENVLGLMPLLGEMLDALLAQDSYTHDKPHPEPYERAAAALGVPPAGCVALENAVRGVQSAVAAGYGRVVGITTTMPRKALAGAGAHRVVATHGEAAHALEEWLRPRAPGNL